MSAPAPTSGDDFIDAGALFTDIDGLAGMDTLILDYSSAVYGIYPLDGIRLTNYSSNSAGPRPTIIFYYNGTGDEFSIDNVENFDITGTNGDDLFAGFDVSLGNHFYGLGGNDRLIDSVGDDILDGGDGDDSFLIRFSGNNDIIYGGNGIDILDLGFGDRTDDINVDMKTGYADGKQINNIEILYGSLGSGNDTVIAQRLFNLINGGSGTDYITIDCSDSGSNSTPYDWIMFLGDQYIPKIDYWNSDGSYEQVDIFNFEHIEILGSDGGDIFQGTANADIFYGLKGHDQLTGNDGDDHLDGGESSDTMTGGTGNDTYWVDNAGDTIVENADEGTDHVNASISFALRSQNQHLETLTLTGSANINGTGNGLANTITGNSGDNILNGAWGNDILVGGAGNDTFRDDSGADQMTGGLGNDIYWVDSVGDTIVENANEGIDGVFSSISFALRNHSQHLETLTLTGSANINGTGNGLANTITGNSGDNILNGAWGDDNLIGGAGNDIFRDESGADTMTGGLGNDIYWVDNAGDTIVENVNEGTDHVNASISFALRSQNQHLETLTLTGSANINGTGNGLANTITGNSGDNILNGAWGNDILVGGAGNDIFRDESGADTMTGGAGADQFIFDDGQFGGLTYTSADRVTDFISSEGDILDLALVDANSSINGDQAFTFIGSASFSGHASELRYSNNGIHTLILGDTNGDGIADLAVRLDGIHLMHASDFIL